MSRTKKSQPGPQGASSCPGTAPAEQVWPATYVPAPLHDERIYDFQHDKEHYNVDCSIWAEQDNAQGSQRDRQADTKNAVDNVTKKFP